MSRLASFITTLSNKDFPGIQENLVFKALTEKTNELNQALKDQPAQLSDSEKIANVTAQMVPAFNKIALEAYQAFHPAIYVLDKVRQFTENVRFSFIKNDMLAILNSDASTPDKLAKLRDTLARLYETENKSLKQRLKDTLTTTFRDNDLSQMVKLVKDAADAYNKMYVQHSPTPSPQASPTVPRRSA